MAKEYQPLPFGGGTITHEEFLEQRLSYAPAHEDPAYQADLGFIAANLDILLEKSPIINEFQAMRKFSLKVQRESWAVVRAAARYQDVRNGQEHLVYRLGCEHFKHNKHVHGRYFEILRNKDGLFNFTELTLYGEDHSWCVGGVIDNNQQPDGRQKHPTIYDMQELQHAVLSLELLETL